MSNLTHFSMGALNKKTLEYVFPRYASKNESYICPSCNTDVVFRSGNINRKHFSHPPHGGCKYYISPSESEQHKCGKRLIKKWIDDKENISVTRYCRNCREHEEQFNIKSEDYTDDMIAIEEFKFTHNSQNCYGDVVLTNAGKIMFIFEVLHTHHTAEERRPHDLWSEFKSLALINTTPIDGEINIECVRNVNCEECEEHRLDAIKQIEKARLESERLDREQAQAEIVRENKLKQQKEKLVKFEKTAKLITSNKFKPHSILASSSKNGLLIEFGKKSPDGKKIECRTLSSEKIKITNQHNAPRKLYGRPKQKHRLNKSAIESINAWRENGYKIIPSLDKNGFMMYEIKYKKVANVKSNELHITEYIDQRVTSADYKNDTTGAIHDFYEMFAEAEIDDIDCFDDEYEDSPLDIDDLIGNIGNGMVRNVSPFTQHMANDWLFASGKERFKNWYKSELNSRSALSEESDIQKNNKYFLHDTRGLLNTGIFAPEHYCKSHNIPF